MPASSAGAITDMAVLLTGRVVVNLNYTAGREALRAAMGSAGIRNVITDRRFLAKLKDRGLDLSNVFDGVALHNIEDLKTGIGKAEGLLMLAAASVLPAGWAWRLLGHLAAPEDTAAILFSSGSEGTPKGYRAHPSQPHRSGRARGLCHQIPQIHLRRLWHHRDGAGGELQPA